MFVVSENSGWIYAGLSPSFDDQITSDFIRSAHTYLKESDPAALMTLLTTPYHWAFCIEGNPLNDSHRFCKFCVDNHIERRTVTSVPTEIPVLEKGWPGVPARPKTKRRIKLAAPEASREAAPEFLP